MTTYSYAQLEQLWINAGGPAAVAPIAAAIAEAESQGNSQAQNDTDNGGTQTSWGLWQISNGTHNQPVPNILDPVVNAQQAVAKYQGEGNSFSPAWGTYDSGAYTAYLSNNTPPESNGVPTDPGATAATLTSATSSTAAASTCITGEIFGFCPLSKSEARAVIGGFCLVAGVMIALPALVLLTAAGFRRSGAGGAAMSAVSALEPIPVYGHAISYSRERSAVRRERRQKNIRKAARTGRAP